MYVFSKQTAVVVAGDRKVRIYEGEVWSKDDEVVKAHPAMFSPTPTKVRTATGHTKPKADAPVEAATKAPGEKRRTTRAR